MNLSFCSNCSSNSEMEEEKDPSSFSTGKNAQELGLSHVPECYIVPPSNRPLQNPEAAFVPVIDMEELHRSAERRSAVVRDVGKACQQPGFFQIVNHGICRVVMEEALASASDFFKLPAEEKIKFMSDDVNKPVRYEKSFKDGADKVQFWRVFLKHYAHPLKDWIDSWPLNPPNYRENMGKYAVEARKVAMEVMGVITESLGLGPTYMMDKMDKGAQVMAINCYPPCPQPGLALGLPPHSDYSIITIHLQSSPGLQLKDSEDGTWRAVPQLEGALQVHVGDHLEVLSNGLYKSVVHRVTLNPQTVRLSIASLHTLALDEKMGTAEELIDEEHPPSYRESSFRDFLKFLSTNDIGQGKSFIETLKVKK